MELILIRHPAVIAPCLCYGRSEVALAEPPRIECARLIEWLNPLCGGHASRSGRGPRLYSSPLSRCASIAEGLSAHFGVAVRYDARLQEMDFGRWEGLPWDQVPRAEIDAWAADVERARPHGGESVTELAARAGAWLDDLPGAGTGTGGGDGGGNSDGDGHERHGDHSVPVVAVTHAGTIRVLAARALGLPLAQCLDWQIGLGGRCHLRRRAAGSGWTLLAWNAF